MGGQGSGGAYVWSLAVGRVARTLQGTYFK